VRLSFHPSNFRFGGIVGDSAAGKTTLTRGIAQILGEENVTVIGTDDYHRYDRHQPSELGITALHPDCNHLDIVQQHPLSAICKLIFYLTNLGKSVSITAVTIGVV
jgi:uridine kinase